MSAANPAVRPPQSSTNPHAPSAEPQPSYHAPTARPEKISTNSSLYEKVPLEIREPLDRAIVDRDPPTYGGVFDKFKLDQYDVSYTAFYYYARRIRLHAAKVSVISAALPEDDEAACHAMLPRILRTRLLETLMDDEVKPTHIRALTEAWRMAAAHNLTASRLSESGLLERIHTESKELKNAREAMKSLVEALQAEHAVSAAAP